MADIKFRKLISTETGVGATSGRETAKFFNENFDITQKNLEAIWSILELVVQSYNIEGIRIRPVFDKEDDTKLLYNIFEYNLDGDLEEGEWFPIQLRFEDVVGDVAQNPQLKEVLDKLTPLSRFVPVESQVQTNTSNISQHDGRLTVLEKTSAEHGRDIDDLQDLTEQHSADLRLKTNQVLENFTVTAKGTGYRVGTTIYDAAQAHVLNVDAVDSNGGIITVSMSSLETPDPFYVKVENGGTLYKPGEIIAADNGWNAKINLVDAYGSILEAEKTVEPVTETVGMDADLKIVSGSGASVSTTTYPTIYLQCVNNGQHPRLIFYLNNDLSNPYEIIGYPEFKNVQKIIDEASTYYELWVSADSAAASDYTIGDTFKIDGTDYTGQIVDTSTEPYGIITDIPQTSMTDLKGTYSTTADKGNGHGLRVVVGSVFHPQQTTNEEFNRYMENYTEYVQDLIDQSLAVLESSLKALIATKVDQVDFDNHINDFNNPHQVTKEQVGLSNVDNTADLDKPISNAVKYELNTLNQKFNGVKRPLVVSTKYYEYIRQTNALDPNVIYFVGNLNNSWETDWELIETGITSPYANGEILYIDGTEWQIQIVDAQVSPMLYTASISSVTEYDVTGTYETTSVTGTGKGLKIKITSIER